MTQTPQTLLDTACERVKQNSLKFGALFPNYGDDYRYILNENKNWVAGFWPGMVWTSFALSADSGLRKVGASLLPSFERRLDQNIHINHDLGFLFTLSARAQHQLTGDLAAYDLALRAAKILVGRYRPKGKYIQSWGPVGEEERGGQIIIDNMMNLPLLFWASQETEDPHYRKVALDHAQATADHIVREDGSTFHTFFFNQYTGEPLQGVTHQGYADDSMWARGQAWGICGFAMAAAYCPDKPYMIETARSIARRFMAELPEDNVPFWDFWLPDGAPTYRDSSAGSIALVGLLRLAQLDSENKAEYAGYIDRLYSGLVELCWDSRPNAQGLLLHGASHVPKGQFMDAYMIYGDYFMLEALTMMTGNHTDFWVSNQSQGESND